MISDTKVARELANAPPNPFWDGQMRQTLLWACDIIDAANVALIPPTDNPGAQS